MKTTVEISAYSVQWAINAQNAGANRIELCANMYEGGTTPSCATIELVRKKLDIDLFVIIRPRGGDFYYSDIEFETMKRDIELSKQIGVNGIVLGLLNIDGTVDIKRTQELVELSAPLPVTFHRAFDISKEPFNAMEDIISTGCKRILTSGQKASAFEGVDLISKLVKKAKNRICIMPGSGINENNILEIKNRTNTFEFHLSGKKIVKSPVKHINTKVSFNASNSNSIPEQAIADMEQIKKLCELLKS